MREKLLCVVLLVMFALSASGLVGCSSARWIKVTTVTMPKPGFTYQESFYTRYRSEPEGWPK